EGAEVASDSWLPSPPVSAKSRDVQVSSSDEGRAGGAATLRLGMEWACARARAVQDGSVVGTGPLESDGRVAAAVGVAVSVALLLLSSTDVCLEGAVLSQMTRMVRPRPEMTALSSWRSSAPFLHPRKAAPPPLRRFSCLSRLSLREMHRGMLERDLKGLGCRLRRLRAGSVLNTRLPL
ncbi:unnamed protein product, partial [Ixodes pacificus]